MLFARSTPDQTPAWDIVPGALDTAMLAFQRRPGVLHCNTYLLQTPDYVLVIDPGSDAADARTTADIAAALLRDQPRQAAVCLTHCHLDHCAAAGPIVRAALPEATVICHSEGARALKLRDPELTLATLTALDFPEMPDAHPLFAGSGPSGVSREMRTQGGGLRSLSIPIAPRNALQVYHTPGHSPDSLCFRVGGALFAGDLPFAAGPGLIRFPGWDADQLRASLHKILWLLDHANISAVYPGHGRALTLPEARRILGDMLQGLDGGASFHTGEGKGFPPALLRACSTLLHEAGIDHSPDLADALPQEPDRDFQRRYCTDPSSQTLHATAASMAHALDRLLDGDPGGGRLVRRARRRLGDFLCALHGFRFADHAGAVEINHVAAELLRELAPLPRFQGFDLHFEHAVPAPEAQMDGEVLADLMETALEALAEHGAPGAAVRISQDQDQVRVQIAAPGAEAALAGTLHAYLRLSMQAYGCGLDCGPDHCTFIMPRAKDDA